MAEGSYESRRVFEHPPFWRLTARTLFTVAFIAALAIFFGLMYGASSPAALFMLFLLVWPVLSVGLTASTVARTVTTDSAGISGQTYLRRRKAVSWSAIRSVEKNHSRALGAIWRVRSDQGAADKITFTEKVDGCGDLLEEVRQRASVTATERKSRWRELVL